MLHGAGFQTYHTRFRDQFNCDTNDSPPYPTCESQPSLSSPCRGALLTGSGLGENFKQLAYQATAE